MTIKKSLAALLAVSFMSFFAMPISSGVVAQSDDMSLSEFLKTTENITASYAYPSMILASNASGKSILPAHTPVIIRSSDTITTSDIVTGGMVDFTVLQDVRDNNGNVLIRAGAPVTAQISFSKPRGRIGQSGEVTITDFHTTAVDGAYVPLSGSVSARPDDKMVMSICLGVIICPLFLLMRGDDAQVPAGTQKTAYTAADVYIKPVRL